jgi:malonate transporter
VSIDWGLCAVSICALMVIYVLSWLSIRLFHITHFQAGTFSQSCYRFNTYIGMAIVMTAFGEQGIQIFAILIGFLIPFINVMAVATLIWYSGQDYPATERNRLIAKALVSNPLILGCLAGILYAHTIHFFPPFVDNLFQLISSLTLPLALISIGGNLTFSALGAYLKPSLVAAVIKLGLLPAAGYLLLSRFHISGLAFKIGMVYFAVPTSVALYVLSSQLKSDTRLASATIVVSILLSIISLTVVLSLVA